MRSFVCQTRRNLAKRAVNKLFTAAAPRPAGGPRNDTILIQPPWRFSGPFSNNFREGHPTPTPRAGPPSARGPPLTPAPSWDFGVCKNEKTIFIGCGCSRFLRRHAGGRPWGLQSRGEGVARIGSKTKKGRPVSKVENGVHVVAMHIAPAACAPAPTWRWGRWVATVRSSWGAPNEWGIH